MLVYTGTASIDFPYRYFLWILRSLGRKIFHSLKCVQNVFAEVHDGLGFVFYEGSRVQHKSTTQ